MAKFEGEYQPGGPGATTMPIPLLGSGSISVSDSGLTVIGTRKKTSPLLVIGVAVAMCTALFCVGMLASPEALGARSGKVTFGTMIAFAIGAAATAVVSRESKLEPWEIVVPWKSVRAAEITPSGELIITVKGMAPKGTLHFVPAAGAAALQRAINAARPG